MAQINTDVIECVQQHGVTEDLEDNAKHPAERPEHVRERAREDHHARRAVLLQAAAPEHDGNHEVDYSHAYDGEDEVPAPNNTDVSNT